MSLTACAGDALLVTGPSGCGKSTLARCLTGLIPHLYRGKLAGAIWLDGLRTTEAPLWRVAEQAGLVFQNPAEQMLATSVEAEVVFGLENLGLSPHVIRQRLEATLSRFDLQALRTRSPQTLSGGEQQKLALAAVTARQPPVLVLDEPLSMLDSTAALDLVGYVAELACRGTTVIICEHRAEYLNQVPNLHTVRLGRPDLGRVGVPVSSFEASGLSSFRLEVAGLSVNLGGRPVLKDLGFAGESGQVLAVVGRNGAGKTTLLRSLVGLQKHQGTVTVDGQRPELGLVFQNADLQLFNATVRDEILYGLKDPHMRLYGSLLGALGLSRYEDSPPLLLSEGEKKRVALATVLMRQPRHGLLLDEPAIGQDAAHKAMLMRIVRALACSGRVVILATHDLTLAAQADRLLLLSPNGFVADGPPSEVLLDDAAWAKLGLTVPDWVRPSRPAVLCKDAVGCAPSSSRAISQFGSEPPAPRHDDGTIMLGGSRRRRKLKLRAESPLHRADPRTKLMLSLAASLAVMLPVERLALFMVLYAALLLWARLLREAWRQVWRLKWVLALLFLLDWAVVSLDLAIVVTLRLILLAQAFALFFTTTTPDEFRLVLEWLRVPYRYAFSVGLAFQGVGLLDAQWRSIREAQQSRGISVAESGWRKLLEQVRHMVSLTVPAVVLTAQRAWAMNEAAHARGFDSPHRRAYRRLQMGWLDWVLLAGAALVSLALV